MIASDRPLVFHCTAGKDRTGVVAAFALAVAGVRRDAIVAELIKRTEGMMNNLYYEAAIEGLLRAKDGRAVEPLRKMTKGIAKAEEVKNAALRGLAIDGVFDSATERPGEFVTALRAIRSAVIAPTSAGGSHSSGGRSRPIATPSSRRCIAACRPGSAG